MTILYLWDHDKEEILETKSSIKEGPDWAHFLFAVDSATNWADHRYGMYHRGDSGTDTWEWSHVPKDRLPKKFIAQLFLLGIT